MRSDQQRTAARYRLVLCCAPAGYGKTILLADLARRTTLACCWYFLTKDDAAPAVFLHTLLASLRHAFPHFGASLEALFHHTFSGPFAPSLAAYQSAIDALLATAAIEISERFVIFLCNYEEVNDSQAINELLNHLVKKLPSQVTLIIESRGIPDLSFASLIVRDELFSLHKDVLRFSSQEIAELACLQGLPPLGEGEAEHLATSFDGWIAGILLGTRIGDARYRLLKQDAAHAERWPRTTSLIEHKRSTLFAYVVNEILKREHSTYRFLQVLSLFQAIDPDLCNAVCQITNAGERLARLERQGLFLSSYESASGLLYVCHPVIRDVLSEQFRAQEPELFTTIHRQAIELWRARCDDEQAVHHALAIGAYELAASLILDASEYAQQQGKHATVSRWLHEFPTHLQENHPHLLLLRAAVALDEGQSSSAVPLLDRAERLAGQPGEGTIMLQAKIALTRSKALFQAGEYQQAQELCQQTLLCVPEQADTLRTAARMRIGICAILLGNFSAGITHLQQALHTRARQLPLSQALEIHSALANSYYLTGNFLLAEHHLGVMLGACEQLEDIPGKVSALILSGLISQDQGQSADAETSFQQALSQARLSPYAHRGEAYALVNLGSLHLEQGKYARALTYLQDGLSLAYSFGNRSLINAALSSLALVYLLLGDAASALLTVTSMEGQTVYEKTMGYERVWHDLTYALVLSRQQRLDEAITRLRSVEAVAQTSGLKRGLFQAKLRLAACHIAQQNQKRAIHLLHEVASLLASNRMYTHLVRVELQWLPELLPLLQSHARLAPLHELCASIAPVPVQQQDSPAPQRHPLEILSSRLTIYAFGEPTVLLDGRPVKSWRMAHAKELFFFLLENHRPVSKETILTSLWPRYTGQSTQTFHNTLYYLRKLLGEACVVFEPTGYSLRLAACYEEQVWYDVQIFQQFQSEAEQALAQKNEARAREAFLKMVELYRGDYGRCFYNDWCAFRRESLRAAYLEARFQLAQIAWHAQAWNESAEHFRQMLRLDHCLEEAHYGLIRCYIRQGKRGAALRQYRFCQSALQEELGVQPGQAIEHLYQRLTARSRIT